jgi:hypothetical protein
VVGCLLTALLAHLGTDGRPLTGTPIKIGVFDHRDRGRRSQAYARAGIRLWFGKGSCLLVRDERVFDPLRRRGTRCGRRELRDLHDPSGIPGKGAGPVRTGCPERRVVHRGVQGVVGWTWHVVGRWCVSRTIPPIPAPRGPGSLGGDRHNGSHQNQDRCGGEFHSQARHVVDDSGAKDGVRLATSHRKFHLNWRAPRPQCAPHRGSRVFP